MSTSIDIKIKSEENIENIEKDQPIKEEEKPKSETLSLSETLFLQSSPPCLTQCPLCPEALKPEPKTHILTHHKDQCFSCKICQKTICLDLEAAKRHLKVSILKLFEINCTNFLAC